MATSTERVRAITGAETTSVEPAASRSDRWLRWLAVAFAVAAALEAIAIFLLGARRDPRFDVGLNFVSIGFFATIVLFGAVGAFIVRRRPRTRVAWVMILMGALFGTSLLSGAYSALYVTPSGGNAGPFAMELLVLGGLLFVPALGLGTTLLLLLYPTDSLLSPRWRVPVAFAVIGTIAWNLNVLFRPGFIDNDSLKNVRNPFGAPDELTPLFDAGLAIGNVLTLVAMLLGAASLIVRYRRGDAIVRAQIRWIAVIAIAAFASFVMTNFIPDQAFFFGLGVTFLGCLPLAIGVAITRYHLYDIDLIINRAIVYGSLTAILAGVFTAGVGLAQRLFVGITGQSSDAAIVVATLVIATLYAPLRKRIEKVIDKRFKYETRRFGSYGEQVRSVLAVIDPVRAAEKLAQETVAELDAIAAAVIDGSGAVLASAGTWPLPPDTPTTRVPLADDGPIRAILVAPARSRRDHAVGDLAALEEVGRLTASAALYPRGSRT